ncbi:MAG: hypothetical protein LIO79_00620 [Rikenellaceae bacterium]|nr:hypothetical protein [Rikenellaceae bacterium]
MSLKNKLDILLADPFTMESTNLKVFNSRPKKMSGSAIVFCRNGSAEVSMDVLNFKIKSGDLSILLPNSIFAVNEISGDAEFTFFHLSDTLFSESVFNIPSEFFRFVKEHPVIHLDKDNIEFMNTWIQLLSMMGTN